MPSRATLRKLLGRHFELVRDPPGADHLSGEKESPIKETTPVGSADKQATSQHSAPQSLASEGSDTVQAGGLQRHAKFWQKLDCSNFVKGVVTNGLQVKLNSDFCPQQDFAVRRTVAQNCAFVKKEIRSLLDSKAITKVANPCSNISPLHVVVNSSGKRRLILDLSRLNDSLETSRTKFDDLAKVRYSLPKGGFLAKFDLKAGYHQISVAESDRELLGFHFDGEFFHFNVLPFGLASGPFVFTKIFRALVARWRAGGLNVAMYLDDGLIWGRSFDECRMAVKLVREDLVRAGADVSHDKCIWQPTQALCWLGFEIDLCKFVFYPSHARFVKARERAAALWSESRPTIHAREIWLGTLASLQLVLGDEAGKYRRFSEAVTGQAAREGRSSSRKVELSGEENEEILYWKLRLSGDERSWERDLDDSTDSSEFWQYDCVIFTDASETGQGAVMKFRGESASVSALLPQALVGTSSTAREISAILFAIRAFAVSISGHKILINTDNAAAATILRKGSGNLLLHRQAIEIWNECRTLGIDMVARWIPREWNMEADAASRESDCDDWEIRDIIFRSVCDPWGTPSVDFFASGKSTKCRRFFSRAAEHGSSGEDAFKQWNAWKDSFGWWVPPVYLVGKALAWARRCKSFGILGCPMWSSQVYLNTLKIEGEWIREVKAVREFPVGTKLFETGARGDAFQSGFARSPFIFLWLDFR